MPLCRNPGYRTLWWVHLVVTAGVAQRLHTACVCTCCKGLNSPNAVHAVATQAAAPLCWAHLVVTVGVA